jgi:hypothetical protein
VMLGIGFKLVNTAPAAAAPATPASRNSRRDFLPSPRPLDMGAKVANPHWELNLADNQ